MSLWTKVFETVKSIPTGAKLLVTKHWRGLAQTGVTALAIALAGACDTATLGLCVVATPFFGCAVGGINGWIGGGGAKSAALGCGTGGIVGTLTLICYVACGAIAIAIAVDTLIGGVSGAIDYSHSSGNHSIIGYINSFMIGGFSNAPIPWTKFLRADL